MGDRTSQGGLTQSSNGRRVPGLVGCNPSMRHMRQQITTVAKRDSTVLICGESGTGKELVARHVHAASSRSHGPFVVADCTALPEALIASQLFGHMKGAFTDAKQSTLGLCRAADGGTLFIDEIGEMQLHTQATLLRCIQERSVLPVGAVEPIEVDVRIIAATHRNLRAMVARGEFREDLYYRLDVVRLEVPALRDRKSDITLLAEHFLAQQASLYEKPAQAFAADAATVLESYSWPGNVRELKNAVESATALSGSTCLGVGDLPSQIRNAATSRGPTKPPGATGVAPLHVVERRAIEVALEATRGNQSQAAQLLEVERHRFARMIRRHGLSGLVSSLRSSRPSVASIREARVSPARASEDPGCLDFDRCAVGAAYVVDDKVRGGYD